MDWKSMAVPTLFFILSAILVGLVVPNLHRLPTVTKKFFDWLYLKEGEIKNRYAAALLQRLSIAVRDSVLHIENTAIEDLKEKAKDGTLTKEELLDALKKIKNECIDMVKNRVKLEGLFTLLTTIVFGNEEGMTKWISDHIETQVATLPPSGLQTNGPKLVTKAADKPVEPKKEEPAAPVVPPTAASPSV